MAAGAESARRRVWALSAPARGRALIWARRLWRSPRVALGWVIIWWLWCGAWALKDAYEGGWPGLAQVAILYVSGSILSSVALYWWRQRRDTSLEGRCPACELPYDQHSYRAILRCNERLLEEASAQPLASCPVCQMPLTPAQLRISCSSCGASFPLPEVRLL